jgi:hypothetical protein
MKKTPEYIEGPKALKNFESTLTALFKASKQPKPKAKKKGKD